MVREANREIAGRDLARAGGACGRRVQDLEAPGEQVVDRVRARWSVEAEAAGEPVKDPGSAPRHIAPPPGDERVGAGEPARRLRRPGARLRGPGTGSAGGGGSRPPPRGR